MASLQYVRSKGFLRALIFYALFALKFGSCLCIMTVYPQFQIPLTFVIDGIPHSTFATRRAREYCVQRLVNFAQSEG